MEPVDRYRVVVSDELSDGLTDALGGVRLSSISGGDQSPLVFVGPGLPQGLLHDPRLRWFHSSNAGVDAVLRAGQGRPWPEKVLVTRTVGRMGERIAQFVLGWLLAECQNIPLFLDQQQDRVWRRQPAELAGGQLAVVYGVGEIGSAVGGLLRKCGIRTVGVARAPRQAPGFERVVTPGNAPVTDARWVVSALPLTDATQGFFDEALFRRFAGATFLNVGRGATVDMDALEAALVDGSVCSAVLDVLPTEPPAAEAACWRLPRTVVTSHSAGVTEDSDVIADFTACLREVSDGRRPRLAVRTDEGY
ncbi:NAD(P)-dependent oxidoreductase [Streptacidiphilus fuscans]|uniref:D-2-hydroxyacid dehydrogenase n=1 Tax=Streptacidiphilus fuscans TaxID=2789292 RepID=A0A931AWQ3_9ACTN|nr:NAD(P)-dependent oxidoreductase [Streptacidiphilus fuscans]MBF9066910.1 D-2-hydroxyacid dehydrogenase [Streptacidiphilus fuscans]